MDLAALTSDLVAVIAPVFLIAALGFGWARAGLPFDGAFHHHLHDQRGDAVPGVRDLDCGCASRAAELATMALAATACHGAGRGDRLRHRCCLVFRLPLSVYLPALSLPQSPATWACRCACSRSASLGLGLAVAFFATLAVAAVHPRPGHRRRPDRPEADGANTGDLRRGGLAGLFRHRGLEVPRWAREHRDPGRRLRRATDAAVFGRGAVAPPPHWGLGVRLDVGVAPRPRLRRRAGGVLWGDGNWRA